MPPTLAEMSPHGHIVLAEAFLYANQPQAALEILRRIERPNSSNSYAARIAEMTAWEMLAQRADFDQWLKALWQVSELANKDRQFILNACDDCCSGNDRRKNKLLYNHLARLEYSNINLTNTVLYMYTVFQASKETETARSLRVKAQDFADHLERHLELLELLIAEPNVIKESAGLTALERRACMIKRSDIWNLMKPRQLQELASARHNIRNISYC